MLLPSGKELTSSTFVVPNALARQITVAAKVTTGLSQQVLVGLNLNLGYCSRYARQRKLKVYFGGQISIRGRNHH